MVMSSEGHLRNLRLKGEKRKGIKWGVEKQVEEEILNFGLIIEYVLFRSQRIASINQITTRLR